VSFVAGATSGQMRGVLSFLSAIRVDALGDGVAVDAQSLGSVRNTLFVSRKGFLNVKLFEFFKSFVEHYVTVEHIFDHSFETGAYLHFSRPI
jgi:hypothetical protein